MAPPLKLLLTAIRRAASAEASRKRCAAAMVGMGTCSRTSSSQVQVPVPSSYPHPERFCLLQLPVLSLHTLDLSFGRYQRQLTQGSCHIGFGHNILQWKHLQEARSYSIPKQWLMTNHTSHNVDTMPCSTPLCTILTWCPHPPGPNGFTHGLRNLLQARHHQLQRLPTPAR